MRGDLHFVGVRALSLALISEDHFKYLRDRGVVRTLLRIPPESDTKDEEAEEETVYTPDEFRRQMAELRAKTAESGVVEAEWT